MSDIAFVFPGQGSQSVGMLDGFSDPDGVIARTLEEASEVLGRDLAAVIGHGPEEELNRTETTQPAMLATGVAVHRLWTARGGRAPRFMAGHSLGEYSALVAAGALELGEAVALVADRARFMQEAVPEGEGSMAAVLGLDDATVEELCGAEERRTGQVVRPVNFNAPGQVVVAGAAGAVTSLMEEAGKAGAKRTVELPVSIPSHCPLMEPAARHLSERIGRVELRSPAVEVINNVDVASPEDPEAIRDALVRQLANPVRWTATIGAMREQGVAGIVEMGPGKVLCGLNKRIDRRMPCMPLTDDAGLDQALEQAQQGDS